MSAKRLLFVDDDRMVLAGLRRALHEMREAWEMEFAASGQEALEAMRKTAFDAVVTDMRMPGMDGAELLDRIKDRYPEVIRIVLSGQSEKEAMLRSIAPAHQYLAKPCDLRELKLRLTQAFASRDLVRNPGIAAAVARLRSIPSLPAIYNELTTALRSETTSLAQIEEIVARDVGMATKILQLANSAFIGVHGSVTSLRQAVSLIGLDTVRTLTLSIHVFSHFDRRSAIATEVASLWEHSVEVGSLAQRIAAMETSNKALAEECFAAGLLHDVGKVILLSERPKEYSEIRNRLKADGGSVEDVESDLLGCSHAQLGGYLMSIWGLPTSLVQAVAFHHRPSQAIESEFSTLTAVHSADALVHLVSNDGEKTTIDGAYLEGLGLTGRTVCWQSLLDQAQRTL
ncbi:MAG TPA: response regulator [Acidobacteriaceae bacterium]|jgi:HD-like signal output (HDOD) protein|nr:response regulator [Acidobacteriaceae bacterium]